MVLNMSEVRQHVRYAFPWQQGGLGRVAPRQELYKFFEDYYFNSIYEEQGIAAFNAALATTAENVELRGIYNPVAPIVDFYTKYVLTGRLGPEGEDVDLTIAADNARIIEPLLRVWRWSNLQTEKDLIPFYAANLGDCLLVVVDRPPARTGPDTIRAGRVWIEVRHPGELVDYDLDERGNLTYAKLESVAYERDAISGMKRGYTYGRIFTKTEYRTEKDREPFAYRADGLTAWPNPHGFVPLVLVQHKRVGDDFGVNAYHNGLSAINELNLQASYLSALVGEHLGPQWAVFGASIPAGGLARDGKVWGFPQGSDAKALIADLRVADAYVHINAIRKHLEDLFPELALPRLREGSQLTGVAVRGMLTDLIKNGELARDNYEAALVRAGQMALSMGANVGGSGQSLWGADIGTYAADEFDHRYSWPPILPLSELEQLQVDAEKAALEREIAIGKPVVQAPFTADTGNGGTQDGQGQPGQGGAADPAALLKQQMGGQ